MVVAVVVILWNVGTHEMKENWLSELAVIVFVTTHVDRLVVVVVWVCVGNVTDVLTWVRPDTTITGFSVTVLVIVTTIVSISVVAFTKKVLKVGAGKVVSRTDVVQLS